MKHRMKLTPTEKNFLFYMNYYYRKSENNQQNNDLLSKNYFPRNKYQLSYLAKFTKIVNGEENVFINGLNQLLITITQIMKLTTH